MLISSDGAIEITSNVLASFWDSYSENDCHLVLLRRPFAIFLSSWKFENFEILKNLKLEHCHARVAMTRKFRKCWAHTLMFCMTPKTRNFGRRGRFEHLGVFFRPCRGPLATRSRHIYMVRSTLLFWNFAGWPEAGSRGGAEHKWFSGTFRKFGCMKWWFWRVGLDSAFQFG